MHYTCSRKNKIVFFYSNAKSKDDIFYGVGDVNGGGGDGEAMLNNDLN